MRVKRFYLLALSFALMGVTAFAQNGLNPRPWQGRVESLSTTIKGIARQAQPNAVASKRASSQLVTPPATATVETWYTADGTFNLFGRYGFEDQTSAMATINVAFDGDDLYIQGLAADANSSAGQLWVKATKNAEGKYVIPANQFMGTVSFWMSTNDYYFTALDADGKMTDAVLDFDAEKQQFTTNQTLIINGLLADVYAYQTFTNVTITKFNEVAAMPAVPSIVQVDFGEWSHGISCSIPTVGTNGETLNPQKLFYTVWTEINGVQEPYTFTAEMYYAFEEDATEVPYATNYGSWDGRHSIYFYDDAAVFDAWDKVGIQSIYYGGGDCKKTEISWVNLRGTGIRSIENGQSTVDAAVYNLAGQRIGSPRKGLNIINGKKVVIK